MSENGLSGNEFQWSEYWAGFTPPFALQNRKYINVNTLLYGIALYLSSVFVAIVIYNRTM